MKNIKESILNMPVWKAGVCVFLIMFGMSVLFEIVLSHTVFHVFDRVITKFEKINQADKDDLDSIDRREQAEYCDKYKSIQRDKIRLQKQSKNNIDYDFEKNLIKDHEIELNVAIENHLFNLNKCQEKLKREKA